MASINLPLRIEYRTEGVTPIRDVITSLQAAEQLIGDGVELLPSFIPGLAIQRATVNVRSLTQESPLRELLLVTLIVTFQDDLKQEIPPMLERLFGLEISDQYDSILTVVVMIVLFYGVALARDAAARMLSEGPAKAQLRELERSLAEATGKTQDEVRTILKAKYAKPGPVKSLIRSVSGFFRPSHMENNAPIQLGSKTISREVVADVPYSNDTSEDDDFERFDPHSKVLLHLHATDVDKVNTGWAAVPKGVCDERLKMKLIPPVAPKDLFGKKTVTGDIVLISRMTADGFKPAEIHLTSLTKRRAS